jgi:aquaporin Z
MKTKVWLAEVVGTFGLVFFVAGAAAAGGDVVAVALALGLSVAALVYAFGPISGAHFNPAVTFAVALRGRLSWPNALVYWLAQFAGAIIAAAALWFIFGGASSGLGATIFASGMSPAQAIVVELILTFFLANAVLQTTKRKSPSSFAGLAIGFTLAAAALVGGPLTGASLNPARTFGPALFTGNLDTFWIYLVGPAAGAGLAALVDRQLK